MKSTLIVLIIVFVCIHAYSQELTGPVLKKELAGKYEGELKKGLAHGLGTAIGLDAYTGHFSKGLPESEGTYTFGNGDIYLLKVIGKKGNTLEKFLLRPMKFPTKPAVLIRVLCILVKAIRLKLW